MIIGSGLLAKAFSKDFIHDEDVCIYAAGVSNSRCNDNLEFIRERNHRSAALGQAKHLDAFVYFGTCSVADPETQRTAYVQHKLAMEKLIHSHPRHLILRLPQVAGKSNNPNTLLNFLYSKILCCESFDLWSNASRNIIDVGDVLNISKQLIAGSSHRNTTINIANPINYPIIKIVTTIEELVGKRSTYNLVECGSEYSIDVRKIKPILERLNLTFDVDYLKLLLTKYYG